MNHEMNTVAIGRQEAFSTMVSNKVPATAHCLSDGIHKAKESCGEQRRKTLKAVDCGKAFEPTQVKNRTTLWCFAEKIKMVLEIFF